MRLKKFLLTAAAIAGLFTMTACENQNILAPKPPNLNKLFNFTASVTCETSSFSALFSRTAVGSWDITITEPYEIQGISFSCSKNGTEASFYELTAAPSTSDFSNSPLTYIADSLETAVQNSSASVIYGDSGFAVNAGDTILYFEQGSAVPKAFEITDKQIKAEISEFNITEEIFKDGADVVLVL